MTKSPWTEHRYCRPIDPRYVEAFSSISVPAGVEEAIGVSVADLIAFPDDELAALARRHPLEAFAALTMAGIEAWRVLPADVMITVAASAFGIDPRPFLALPPADGLRAFEARIEPHVDFLTALPPATVPLVLERAFTLGGDFARAAREVCGDDRDVPKVN